MSGPKPRIVWNGEKLLAKIRAAEIEAVQETIDAAASQARGIRGDSSAKITSRKAHKYGQGVRGRWGVFPAPSGRPFYELFRETGTAFIPGDNAKRRAADAEHTQLASRIRARLDG